MRNRAAILALTAALAAGTVAHAQLPRPNRPPRSMTAVRSYLTTATIGHTVTVAQSGGDFDTLSEALGYVATQTRSDTNMWFVLMYPGLYCRGTANTNCTTIDTGAASGYVVPTYTHVQGVGDGPNTFQPTFSHSGVLLQDTQPSDSSVFVSLGDRSSLSNLTVYAGYNASAVATAYTALKTTGTMATLRNVGVWIDTSGAGTVYGVESNGIVARELTIQQQAGGSGVTLFRAASSSSQCFSCQMTKIGGTPVTMVSTGAGAIARLFWTRIDTGATTDLTNAAGTLSVKGTAYATSSGVITSQDTIQSGTTAPATCLVGQLFVDTDTGPSLCTCTASNVWKCAVVS